MATVTLTLTDTCGGGGHLTINANLNGVDKGDYRTTGDELLAAFTDAEIEAFMKAVIRLHKIGKTNAQVRADLIAGLVLTI